jgi:dienelactone hydrolase
MAAMRRAVSRTFCVGLLLLAIPPPELAARPRSELGAQTPGPQGPEAETARRQLWFIPIPGEQLLMRATVMRPPGAGPFPLVVVNHGSVQSADMRAKFPMPDYPVISQWFLDRGYAVALPQRPGHGETAGPYFEDQGPCNDADFRQAGLRTADSIKAAIDYLTRQPFVRKAGVIVVGQSAGGWGAIALASRNPPNVKAVINFAGGRGGHSNNMPNNNCSPDRLIEAAGSFGESARIPELWLYSESDDYFGPALSRRMAEAFSGAGGRAEFHLLPPLPQGHRLINSGDAFVLWAPILEKFLANHP